MNDSGNIGSETVGQDNGLEMGMILTEGRDESFGGLTLTVVFGYSLPGVTHVRGQRKSSLEGMMTPPPQHLMIRGGRAISLVFLTA